QADQSRTDQRGIGKEDDAVLDQIEQEDDQVAERAVQLRVDLRALPSALRRSRKQMLRYGVEYRRYEEGHRHREGSYRRDERKNNQLLIGLQNRCAGFDQFPTTGETRKHGFFSCQAVVESIFEQ